MTFDGTIYLDFDCVHRDYRIDSPEDASLLRYVLEREAGLNDWLFGAVDRVYPNEVWSSPGNSMLRRLYYWILKNKFFPELHNVPDSQDILERLQQVRDRMKEVYESRSFERSYYPDFPIAARLWRDRRYQIVSFSTAQSKQQQNQILELAAPDCAVVPFNFGQSVSASNLDLLFSYFPQAPDRRVLIVDFIHERVADDCWHKGIRSVVVNRRRVEKEYFPKGYRLNVGLLSDFDPVQEPKREDY